MQFAWQPDTMTFRVREMADLTLLWGLDSVVLRFVGSESQRVPFVNESLLRDRLSASDIAVAAIDPGLFEGDVSNRMGWLNEVYAGSAVFEFCERVRCPIVQVSSFLSTSGDVSPTVVCEPIKPLLDRIGDTATIALKNEIGGNVMRADGMADVLNRMSDSRLTASWCPATSVGLGDDVVEAAQHLGPHTTVLRCSDIVAGTQGLVAYGTGEVPWPDIMSTMVSAGFDGVLCLELPTDTTRTEGLRAATRLISDWRGATNH